ncbi:CoA transferase [Streptomyces sp. NPDC001536]|uniref:CaiB/BaiF CoA-transferase family protein n=1 Tax=Streptomyces sp. NPDC001536 TaxID=3364583 RepID=UPI0036C3D062
MLPLEGLRILDLTDGLAGRLAGGLLADFGADVVRYQAPGDDAPPLPQFIFTDHAKTVGHLTPDGTPPADELARADVCFVDRPDQVPAEAHDRLIVVVTPPCTTDGTPWAGGRESAELLHAYFGFAAVQASYSGRPVDHVYPYITIAQGVWSATCAAAALLERETSGRGQTVEVNGVHAANIFLGYLYGRDEGSADQSRAIGPGGLNPLYTRYRTADGRWVFVGALGPKFARATLETTGSLHLLDDDRIRGRLDALWDISNHAWVRAHFAEYFASKPADDWIAILEAADIPCTIVQSREEWFSGPQVAATGMVREIDHPQLGRVRMPGVPVTSLRERRTEPPKPTPTHGRGPLDGVRVTSLGTFVAGPYAAALLAELGANVVKVEPPVGDPWRMTGFVFNRATRSLAVDLSTAAGRATLDDVVRHSDVVMNNFRLGVMERLGYGFDRLASLNPRAISVGVTAYGESGPLAPRPGYDTVLQAAGGIMTAQGGTGEPVVLSLPVNDHTTAVVGAFTAVLGLLDRARFGVVRQLSTSLAATSAFLQLTALTDYAGRPAPATGGDDFTGPDEMNRIHPTSDGFVRVQADPGTVDIDTATLASSLAGRTTDEALAWCASHHIAAVKVRTASEVCADPYLHEHGLMRRAVSVSGTVYTQPGRFAGFSRTPQRPHPDAPGLGEHTHELLTEIGYAPDRIRALAGEGVVVTGEPLDLEFSPLYR